MGERCSSAAGHAVASDSRLPWLRSKLPQGFEQTKRLRRTAQYRRFFNQSEVFRLTECVVFRIKNDLGHFRLGITLKARGNSVNRNRVKRRIREAFRTQGESLGGYDYNVVVPIGK